MKILKIEIRSAQNVGKVWISRKKSSWPHLGPSGLIFCVGRKKSENAKMLPIFLGGPGLLKCLHASPGIAPKIASAKELDSTPGVQVTHNSEMIR